MSIEPFSGAEFKLDTSNMSVVAEKCETLAEKMRTLKQDLDNSKVSLVEQWHGKGSNMFQKKYHYLAQQLKDLSEDLYEIAENIRKAEDAYIQSDMDAAKILDGVSQPT